jgi:hypothetical protein
MAQPKTVLPDCKNIFQTAADLRTYHASLAPLKEPLQKIPMALAKIFLRALRESLLGVDAKTLWQAWSSKSCRTRFYAKTIIPEIARALGLIHRTERFTVDHVLVKNSINGHDVPNICIESENDYAAATHEIEKLCCLNAPLKVLITATSKRFDRQPAGSAYAQLRKWQAILRSHHENNPNFDGVFLVVVGPQSSGELRFTACALYANGDLAIPLDTLLRRDLE